MHIQYPVGRDLLSKDTDLGEKEMVRMEICVLIASNHYFLACTCLRVYYVGDQRITRKETAYVFFYSSSCN